MDHLRHHADQQGADGDSAGSCEFTKPGFDCEVESSSLCPDSPWMPRDPNLSDRAVTIRVPRHFGIASWRRRIARVREFELNRPRFVVRAKEWLKQRLQNVFLGATSVIVLN